MNWNRILNTMIIIFLVLNIAIFAFGKLSIQNKYVLSDERESLLKEILYENGVTMYNFYPSYEPMSSLVVQAPEYDRDTILNRVFDGQRLENLREMTEERVIYEAYNLDDEVLVFYTGNYAGIIDYSGPSPLYQLKAFTEEEAIKLASDFADDLIGELLPVTLSDVHYDEDTNRYEILFNQIYDESVMFCNYVRIVIGEEGIMTARASLYPVVSHSSEKKELYPVDEVIYMWMDTIDVASDELARIKQIEIGYDLGLDELNKDASIEVVPYYRITMQDGSRYDISAYTNQLQKEAFIGAFYRE